MCGVFTAGYRCLSKQKQCSIVNQVPAGSWQAAEPYETQFSGCFWDLVSGRMWQGKPHQWELIGQISVLGLVTVTTETVPGPAGDPACPWV